MGTQNRKLDNRFSDFSMEERFEDSIKDLTLREVIYSMLALIVLLLFAYCVSVFGVIAPEERRYPTTYPSASYGNPTASATSACVQSESPWEKTEIANTREKDQAQGRGSTL
jgi:hypothetical protein